jgi:hypothetical protein
MVQAPNGRAGSGEQCGGDSPLRVGCTQSLLCMHSWAHKLHMVPFTLWGTHSSPAEHSSVVQAPPSPMEVAGSGMHSPSTLHF